MCDYRKKANDQIAERIGNVIQSGPVVRDFGSLFVGQAVKRISPYQIASYCAILNKKDESFDWLEKAYKAHNARLVAIKTDSDFDNLHADARFADLLHRLKLPN